MELIDFDKSIDIFWLDSHSDVSKTIFFYYNYQFLTMRKL